MIEVFDFDGTLIDLWPRYYKVFCAASRVMDVPFEKYKRTKKKLEKDDSVADSLGIELPPDYYSKKRQLLEKLEFLLLDKPLIDPISFSKYFNENDAILLSKRRRPENLLKEMHLLNFELDKDKIVILKPENGSKAEWIKTHFDIEEHINIIGDGREEIEAAKENINTQLFFVNTGLISVDVVRNTTEVSKPYLLHNIKDYFELYDGGYAKK